ncbi:MULTISPECIES: WXG100 family type VII secretion target [unclassified Actinotalea]|uniref:WXG100 family type VII secretion target n=1 Tax=unclassified Actinotalea TaxID=2638618 RepID=UPI0015F5837E|nr:MULTISPECIES: WXG100 family type VII secretion target [unclassified Actinotalea]
MAGEVSAADGALKAGASAVAQSRGELENELSVLRGKLEGMRGAWIGQGATAFNTLMQRWEEDAKKIISALNEFENNLLQSQSTYTASDEAQSSSMARLTSRLG